MRVAVIGASGKVGRQVVQHLAYQNQSSELELVLSARNNDRLRGIVADITSTFPLIRSGNDTWRSPRIRVTDEARLTSDCDIAVIVAGLWPSADQAKSLRNRDQGGRLAQSYANVRLVTSICKEISYARCPPMILVVSNQSDMMSTIARSVLPADRVLGVGGMLDSSRFRSLAAQALKREPGTIMQSAHMIGYHNSSMLPLLSSVSPSIAPTVLEQIVEKTRSFGQMVSTLQRDPAAPSTNTGSVMLPAYCIYRAVAAFVGQSTPIEESHNIVLDEESARTYGTKPGLGLSVPVFIGAGAFRVADDHAVSADEQRALRTAQESMQEDTDTLLEEAPKMP